MELFASHGLSPTLYPSCLVGKSKRLIDLLQLAISFDRSEARNRVQLSQAGRTKLHRPRITLGEVVAAVNGIPIEDAVLCAEDLAGFVSQCVAASPQNQCPDVGRSRIVLECQVEAGEAEDPGAVLDRRLPENIGLRRAGKNPGELHRANSRHLIEVSAQGSRGCHW